MDVHFNAYKTKYEVLNQYLGQITSSQYVKSINIFISLDDVLHNLHRPLINNEFQVCGNEAAQQLVSNIMNLAGHYKQWGARRHIRTRVFLIYSTRTKAFKNSIFISSYRDKFALINDEVNTQYFFINAAIKLALPIVKNIGDYIEDVFVIDSKYLEPSIIPAFLATCVPFRADWNMLISRDPYDLQYAYRDKWILVSPKGDNTRIVNRGTLWRYIGDRENVFSEDILYRPELYHHDIYPLALAVAGNKYRGIPRLKRIGWKTIFQYLDKSTENATDFMSVVSSRFLKLLEKKGVPFEKLDANLACVSIDRQVESMNEIDQTLIMDQIQFVDDREALSTINEMYFSKFPLNLQFLLARYEDGNPFRR